MMNVVTLNVKMKYVIMLRVAFYCHAKCHYAYSIIFNVILSVIILNAIIMVYHFYCHAEYGYAICR
jgi:hypothetical protein